MKDNRIGDRIKAVRATLPQGVTLIAVSKYHPVEAIEAAYRLSAGVKFANAYCRSDIGQRALKESK